MSRKKPCPMACAQSPSHSQLPRSGWLLSTLGKLTQPESNVVSDEPSRPMRSWNSWRTADSKLLLYPERVSRVEVQV
jgi:hypothetical protein